MPVSTQVHIIPNRPLIYSALVHSHKHEIRLDASMALVAASQVDTIGVYAAIKWATNRGVSARLVLMAMYLDIGIEGKVTGKVYMRM